MHKYFKNSVNKTQIIIKFLFLCLFFFFGCTIKKPFIPLEDRDKIQSFLNQFLFVNTAVYTLFGDKPISEMLIFIGTKNDLMELTEEELKMAIPLDGSIVENWRVWKRYADKIHSKNFIITERPCFLDPSHAIYSLLNVKLVKEVLCQHRATFQEKIGRSFNVDKVIEEFKDPSSYFWKKAFEDHYLSGLLFGYGQENITHFLNHMKIQDKKIQFSDVYNPSATVNNFSIPSFALSPNDKTANLYSEQRTKIRSVYQYRNIIDVTIQRLTE